MWRIQHLAVFVSLLGLPALAFSLQGCGQEAGQEAEGEGPCATGEPHPHLQCGIGACYAFIESCQNGIPQSCGPLVAKSKETPDGIDNDCDGVVDDGIACTTFESQDCYSGSPLYLGKGLCQSGIQICQQGTWSFCTGDVMPQEELCNQRDDDCDGEVDEDCSCDEGAKQNCYGGAQGTEFKPPCKIGQQSCTNGRWGKCEDDIVPTVEQADGSDNDCDGHIDEGFPCQMGQVQSCYTGTPGTRETGECKDGEQSCEQGKWGDCKNDTIPDQEICDGLDNNCDGTTDNADSIGTPCPTGSLGPCSQGTTQCLFKDIVCVTNVTPQVEQCNGIDDNCDGDIDLDPVTKKPLTGTPCSIAILKGACAVGLDTCEGGKMICKQTTFPVSEACNNSDDDCDGIVNNGSLCCPNSLKDGSESDVDCGGICGSTCLSGQSCFQESDCQNQVCGADKKCQPPKCDDIKKNGTETDLDCGGNTCPKCSDFKLCNTPTDCQSGVCQGDICQSPKCDDTVKNGIETDIDCGGSTCPKCSVGKKCNMHSDCDSALCLSTFCQAPTCNDFVKNGTESDIDCGGIFCTKCLTGKFCFVGSDCLSGVCTNSICN